jgi:hypothetical protein
MPYQTSTNQVGWINGMLTSLKTQTATWFVGTLIAIMGLFSSQLTESIKFALNRADLRTKQYEDLATEVSQYIFSAELNTEFIENDWTTRETMTGLLTEYNESITTLRKKEFVYLAWIQKYWGIGLAGRFETFMIAVRKFDAAMHLLNNEFEAVNISKTKDKVDKKLAEEALKTLKPAVDSLRSEGRQLLVSLS